MRALPADMLPVCKGKDAQHLIDVLAPVIFDPTVTAKKVNQDGTQDIVATSAC